MRASANDSESRAQSGPKPKSVHSTHCMCSPLHTHTLQPLGRPFALLTTGATYANRPLGHSLRPRSKVAEWQSGKVAKWARRSLELVQEGPKH